MKGHRLHKEDKDSYHIQHPDGSHFQVAKGPLTSKMHAVIQKMPKTEHFAGGGSVGGLPKLGLGADVGLEAAPAAEPGSGGDLLDTADTVLSKASVGLPANKVTEGTGPVANPDQYAGLMAPEQTEGAPLTAAANETAEPMISGAQSQPFSVLQQPSPDAAQGGPQPQPEVPAPNPILAGMQNAMQGQIGANNAMAAAQGKEADQRAQILQQQLDQMGQQQVIYNDKKSAIDAETERLKQDVEASRVNPSRYFDNMSTGGKVLAIIASAIGGGGAALAGQPNLAFQAIQDAIKRDIESQVKDLDKKQGLLRTNLEISHDLDTAKAMTFNQMQAVTQAKINQAAASSGSAIAKANAQILNANLMAAAEPIKAAIANTQAQQDWLRRAQASGTAGAGGGDSGGFSHDKFNALATIHPEMLKDMNAERKQFQDDRKALADADHLFKVAPGLTSWANTLTPGLPAMRQDTRQLNALTGPFLDKFTKDTSGRVTPQTVQLIEGNLPAPGDSPATIATKRATIRDTIMRMSSYPTLERFGIVAPMQSSGEIAGKYK